jgi:cystathionine beta-lyase family protein involved in aluminum resistance
MIRMNFTTLTQQAEEALAPYYRHIDEVAQYNTEKVLTAFREERVSEGMFAPSSGYGYDDRGRETLDRIYARVFGAEAAIVRHSIACGTHALTIGLFALLRPGDVLLSLTGKPYDTLDEVIGLTGKPGCGSLRDFGVDYAEVALKQDGTLDYEGIAAALDKYGKRVKVAFVQRSKGYLNRPTLTVGQIGELAAFVKARSSANVVVDNCYGEFVERQEPTEVGADLIIGSLIKNPGGGIAESGGYLAGRADLIELCGYRLTSPGEGTEVGATLGQTKPMYKGLFFAPHAVAQALKTAHFAAYIFSALGYPTEPSWDTTRSDIIQAVRCGSAETLVAFCRGIQAGSPVDAFVTCEPWQMPGYSDPVIMAAGTFTQGSSLELSADGPIREPYLAYFQGGLTYESGKVGILSAARAVTALRDTKKAGKQ